tara:strand:- start:652 stop:828 length:177 start_codon:yes stop_codon:yes gene_type:complete
MKYKVILFNSYGAADVDVAGQFTFYTFNSALECCQAWANFDASYEAFLYDGQIWRNYT